MFYTYIFSLFFTTVQTSTPQTSQQTTVITTQHENLKDKITEKDTVLKRFLKASYVCFVQQLNFKNIN